VNSLRNHYDSEVEKKVPRGKNPKRGGKGGQNGSTKGRQVETPQGHDPILLTRISLALCEKGLSGLNKGKNSKGGNEKVGNMWSFICRGTETGTGVLKVKKTTGINENHEGTAVKESLSNWWR